jgi:hypothetical protein
MFLVQLFFFCTESIECFPGIVSRYFFVLWLLLLLLLLLVVVVVVVVVSSSSSEKNIYELYAVQPGDNLHHSPCASRYKPNSVDHKASNLRLESVAKHLFCRRELSRLKLVLSFWGCWCLFHYFEVIPG